MAEFREEVNEKLLEIDDNVFYGRVPDSVIDESWNYIVFGKDSIRKKDEHAIDLVDKFWVVIVRENYIPDELVLEVISKVKEIAGVRLANEDGNYTYDFKGKTNIVVEGVQLSFVRTLKCGNLNV